VEQFDGASAARRFGLADTAPVNRPVDPQRACVQINVVPPQAERLTYADARGGHQNPKSVKVSIFGSLEQRFYLSHVQGLYLRLYGAWRHNSHTRSGGLVAT